MDYKKVNDYEVIYMIRENDEDARDLMLQKYLPIIKKLASKFYELYKGNGADYDDFVQEGLISLNRAINSFGEANNTLFYTYAITCINRHLITYCRNITSKKHMVLNLSEREEETLFSFKDNNNVERDFLFREVEKEFIEFKNSFDFLDSNIFELRFNGFGYKEISTLLDIPISMVDSKLMKIRRCLHKKKKNVFN